MTVDLFSINRKIEQEVTSRANRVRNLTFNDIERVGKWLRPLNYSTSHLARAISSNLNATSINFHVILNQVAPALFLTLSTIPIVSQASFTGVNGLHFSVYYDQGQTLALYSNISSSAKWLRQPVNRDTGRLYGEAVSVSPLTVVDESGLRSAMRSNRGYSSLGSSLNTAKEPVFLHTVALDGRGWISLGFPARTAIEYFQNINFFGGDFHLATADGVVLVASKLPDTTIAVAGDESVNVKSVSTSGVAEVKIIRCHTQLDNDYNKSPSTTLRVQDADYSFYCAPINVAGVHSVYVLAYPHLELVKLVHSNYRTITLILFLMFVVVFASILIYVGLIIRGVNRETCLCDALLEQTEATQQAERKSMNKSIAFARASHDVRGSLASITGLVELCLADAPSHNKLGSYLEQMSSCASDLAGIMSSVLDMSKIEAGKMLLDEVEFNLIELLDEVIDTFYPLGTKKGVDVMLDLSDASVYELQLVRGDRLKLKQILNNLLSNAVKFTSEGHISIRVVAKKINSENAIIADNRNSFLKKLLSWTCYQNKGLNSLDIVPTIRNAPDCMEFVFEVQDTGKGIPKHMKTCIFENYVQVKETALEQEGIGLGLGIVQSLVRLMGGEIRIVDKMDCQKGTCFEFNIFLRVNNHARSNDGKDGASRQHHPINDTSKVEISHVVIVVSNDERRKIAKQMFESLGIKVSCLKYGNDLGQILERIKHKAELGNLSSSRSRREACLQGSSPDSDPDDKGSFSNDRKPCLENLSIFMLIVIDAAAGACTEFSSVVHNFRNNIPNFCVKVVWWENPITRYPILRREEEYSSDFPFDYILLKPLHGSYFYQLLRLHPQLGDPFASNYFSSTIAKVDAISEGHVKLFLPAKKGNVEDYEKPLKGKRILVVDDDGSIRKTTSTFITRLFGAQVDVCKNGKEAYERIYDSLRTHYDEIDDGQIRSEAFMRSLPYDCIIMDCQMPVMDGYEAAKRIREEEKNYDVHIPIIAVTGETFSNDGGKICEAGMDGYLMKPWKSDDLLKTVQTVLDEKNEKWNTRNDLISKFPTYEVGDDAQ